jgi:hypothetical protein
MGNFPALLPNATPLVSRFFGEMSRNVSFKATALMLTLKKVFDFGKVYDVSCNYKQQLHQNKW